MRAEPAAPDRRNVKWLAWLAFSLAIVAAGAGGAWFLLAPGNSGPAQAKPSVFVPLDRFVVNLQAEEDGDAYLQVDLTLQLPDAEQEDRIRQHMPQVRSRVLMLLSGKHKSELTTVAGKNRLASEIVAVVKEPFSAQAKPQRVTAVHFTSFVIQ